MRAHTRKTAQHLAAVMAHMAATITVIACSATETMNETRRSRKGA